MVSKSAYPRGKTLLGALVCLVLALVAAVLVILEVAPLIAAIDASRPVITLWGTVLGGAPLTIMFVAVAAMLLLSLRKGPESPLIARCMIVALVCILLVPVSPWLGRAVVESHLTRHGYRRCPTINERPVKTRWALASGDCPTQPAG